MPYISFTFILNYIFISLIFKMIFFKDQKVLIWTLRGDPKWSTRISVLEYTLTSSVVSKSNMTEFPFSVIIKQVIVISRSMTRIFDRFKMRCYENCFIKSPLWKPNLSMFLTEKIIFLLYSFCLCIITCNLFCMTATYFDKGHGILDVYLKGSSYPMYSVDRETSCSFFKQLDPLIMCPLKKGGM